MIDSEQEILYYFLKGKSTRKQLALLRGLRIKRKAWTQESEQWKADDSGNRFSLLILSTRVLKFALITL